MKIKLHQTSLFAKQTIVSLTNVENRLQLNIMRMKKVLLSTKTFKSVAMLLMGILFFANSWGQITVTFPATGVAAFASGATPTSVGQLVRPTASSLAMYVCTTVGSGATTSALSGTSGTPVAYGNGNFFVYVGTCNASGVPATFVAPTSILSPIQVECWGGGGGGGGTATNVKDKAGAGGAGGNYVKNTAISVTGGTSYNLAIGLGGTKGGKGSSSAAGGAGGSTTFSASTPLVAGGGAGATYVANVGGPASGALTGNSGYSASYTFAGGNGAVGVSATSNGDLGGGGGGAAGQGSGGAGSNGGNATNNTGGTASTGGGNGASIASGATSDGVAGSVPGGGGSGGVIISTTSSGGQFGGAGGNGQMIITFSLCTTPTLTYNVTATANTICNGSSTTIGLDNSQTNVTYQLYAGGSPLSGVTANGSTGNPISFTAQSPSTNTTYTVQSTTANSYCATAINGGSTTSKAITVNSRPVAAITSSNTSITTGNSTSISGTITASGSWTLTLSDASTVTGSGSGTWSKSVSPSSNTTYSISSLTDANCSSISADLTGTETVTVTSLLSQTITFNPTTTVTYGVSPIDLSTSVSASGGSNNPVTFSISNISPTGIASLSGTNNKTLTIAGAGTFTISANQAGNGTYAAAATVNKNFTVDKAVLTVTADNQTNVTYGTAASTVTTAGTAVISGYVGSDNAGNVTITGSPTFTTNYTATTAAASSSITITPVVTGLSATNYSFSPANGSITVTQASLSITASNASKAFGATQASPVTGATAFTSSGLKNSETIGSVTLTYGSGAIASGDAIGSTSVITPSAATGGTFNAANYSISYNTGTLTVVQITTYTENFTTNTFPGAGAYTGTSSFTTNLGTWTSGGGGVGLVSSGITSASMKFKSGVVGNPFATTPTLYGVSSIAFDGKIVGVASSNLTLSNTSSMSSVTSVSTTTTNSGTINVTPSGYNGTFTFTYGVSSVSQSSSYLDNIVFSFLTPTTQATNIVPSSLTNTGAAISWTRPNAGANNQGCIVFVGPSANTFTNPSAGTSYTASTTFGSGTQIGTTGYYCVYNGTGTSVTIASGLASGTNYKVYVLEYNGIAGQSDENYYTASATNNPNTFATTCPTYTLATAAQAAAVCSGNNATINLTGLATNTSTVFNYTLNGAGSNTSSTVTTTSGTTGSFTAALTSSNSSLEIVSITSGACTTTLGSPISVTSFQVDPTPSVGTASATASTICTGTSTSVNLSSSTGNIQWQQSADGSTGWASVSGGSGATSSSYTTANLSAATYYRAQVSSGVCTAVYSSPAVGVSIIASSGGTATPTAASLFTGNNTTITLTGKTGSTIQWEYSTDNSSFSSVGTDGSGDGTTTYTTPNLTVTTYYRAVVTNGSCSSANSSTATVTVTSKTAQNITLASTNTVTYGDAPYSLSVSTDNPSGAALQYSSTNTGVASIDASGNITVGAVGTTIITVTQAGDASYLAGSASQTLTVQKAASTVTPTVGTYTYNGTAQGPNSASHTGSTGTITYSYVGTGATTYTASATRPTSAGTYNVTATLPTDASYAAAATTDAFTIDKASLTVTANDKAKAVGTTLTLGTTAFTHTTLYGADAVSSVTLTSSGATSGAALGTYAIKPSAATGSGVNNYSISYIDGSLVVGTQFTETFDESVVCTTAGNLTCFPSAGGINITTTPLTTIGTWSAAGGGIGLKNPGVNANSIKFNHGSTTGRVSSATSPAVHGVANISYTGVVAGASTNLRLSGNTTLSYNNTIATTNTNGSTAVTAADSIFTFTYTESAATTNEYLDDIIFTFATPSTQASAATIPSIGTTGMSISWTRPNGGKDNQGSVVFVGDNATASWSNPSTGTSYTANTAFGSGTQIGTSGYYCVYNGHQNNVSITGLTEGHTYNVYVLEYNGIAGLNDENYNTSSPSTVSQLIPNCTTPTLTGASQTGTACQGTGATISLSGLVPSHAGLTISYTVDGGAVQTATGVSSDASGVGSFTTSNLVIGNNGKTLQITNIADGSCTQSFTQNVTLTVDATTVAGTVSSAQTICSGSSPASLTLTGNTGSIVEWTSAPTAGFSTPTTIANTSSSLAAATMGSLTSNTYYRAVVKNGACPALNSASALITVSPTSVGGTATYNGVDICAGNVPSSTVSLSGNTGTITWEKSTDASFATGVSSVSGTGTSLTAATIGILSATTYIRAVVTSGVCSSIHSAIATINVLPASVGGTVTGGSTICFGNDPVNDLVLSGNVGSVTKWQSSSFANFSTSVDIANTSNTLTAAAIGALTATTYFRAVVQSGSCSVANSAAATVVVNSPSFTATNATASAGVAVTYTTQSGQSNYSWTYSGVANTDYVIMSGGTSSDNTVTVKWVTSGSQTVSVNYTAAGGCTSIAPATTNTTVSPYTTASSDYFRSNVASGSWATATSWQSSPDNTTWFTASSAPTSAAAAITIQAGHNITASAAVTVPASFTVDGTYTHNQNGGTIPAATWGSSSTCTVTGVTSITALTGLTQSFHNFTWNCSGQTGNFQAASALTTVNGTFTVASTGSTGTIRLTASNGTSNTSNFGNIDVTGGSFYLMAGGTAGTNTCIVNVAGNVSLSNNGFINFIAGSTAGSSTLNIGGDLSLSGTSHIDQTSTGTCALNFIKSSGIQNLTITSTNAAPFSNSKVYTINVGSVSKTPTLQLNSSLTFGSIPVVIASGASVAIGSNTLTVTSTISGAGKILGSSASSLVMNSTSANTFNFGTASATDSLLNTLTLSGTGKVTLGSGVGITSLLSLNNAAAILDLNNNHLTLKSTSLANTAEVGVVAHGATIINGNVTVERYIPKELRNYRDLGASVANAGSVFANWQESGAAGSNVNYGFFITGTAAKGSPYQQGNIFNPASGLDYTTAGAPSMYTYTGTTWPAVTSTKALSLNPFQGYRAIVRGARNFNMGTNPNTMPTATTVRTTGKLVTGDVTITTAGTTVTDNSAYNSSFALTSGSSAYSLIANPYACPVQWSKILAHSSIYNTYWYLDPTYQDPSTGYQRYITVQYSGGVTIVTPNPNGGSSADASFDYIQSGQAIMVNNYGNATPSISFREADKTTGATNNDVFGQTVTSLMSIELYKNNSLADAAVANFNNSFTKAIGIEDAGKMLNSGENISITESNSDLSIDGLPTPSVNDVVPVRLGQLTANTTYQLKADISNFNTAGLQAYVRDNMLNTEVAAGTLISFTPTSVDIQSYKDRFSIVFKQSKVVVPVVTVKGSISIFPNPVTAKSFKVQTSNIAAGKYNVVMVNSFGQEVMSTPITHVEGSSTETITMSKALTSGVYTLVLKSAEGKAVYQTELLAK